MEVSIAESDNVTEQIIGIEEKLEDRMTCLEEEVTGLKVKNNELINHLNLAIRELNAVIYVLNTKSTIEVNTMNVD